MPAPAGANLVNLERVSVAYGTRTVLDAVSLGVAAGERIGVVGRNGGGKSTLLRMLAGVEPPQSGRVTRTGSVAVDVVGQQDDLDDAGTVREVVVGGGPEHAWAGDAQVRGVVTALLGTVDLDRPLAGLSGGERRRVALARALVAASRSTAATDHGLLLLDEPTNHLDVEAADWLAHHLAGRPGALVVVTHDRWFLDTVAERTWEVGDGAVRAYEGGYSAYVLARAERARVAAADEARRANLLRKELAWLRRGPPARTSKPRFRTEAATALVADEPPPRDAYELRRFATARLGRDVIDLEDVTVERGGRLVLDRLTWGLAPGDRVGVVGVNGAGKTTLLRVLDGSSAPGSGRVRRGRTVALASLTQDVAGLDPALRVLEAVEQVRRVVRLGDGSETTASALLERFGFAGERQWTPVSELSGGERRRLQLLRLLVGEPNVLLLDEPTNDLDIETLTVLEDLLDGWAGTLVVVSHDRWFLERVTDRVEALDGRGGLAHLPGGVEEYLERRRAARLAAAAEVGGRTSTRTGDSRAARKELARLERELDRLARREERLHVDLAEAATDHQRVLALDAELRALAADRDDVETRWLELADEAG